jgi:hypothetical protein
LTESLVEDGIRELPELPELPTLPELLVHPTPTAAVVVRLRFHWRLPPKSRELDLKEKS